MSEGGASEVLTATIANGASLSGALSLSGFRFVGVQMPAAWTAAVITFQASFDGTTYADLTFEGTEINYAAAASQYIAADPAKFAGIRYLKIRSGTSSAAVAQGAQRLLSAVTRPLV